jgi:hypothetical protein
LDHYSKPPFQEYPKVIPALLRCCTSTGTHLHPPPAKESIMKHLRRTFAAVATLAGAVLALTTAPAAFAKPLPPSDCCTSGAATGVTLITGGGMPGWQITLIAVGAALAGAVLAVLLDHAWTARKTHPATA